MNGEIITAHRAQLAKWSRMFKSMFTTGTRDSIGSKIEVEEASAAAFRELR